ncbi:MAG: hypothetical protein AAFN79_14585 [Pseudomonadota bacterium]
MSRRATAFAAVLATGLAGCATYDGTEYRPIVDEPQTAAYEADLAECRQLALTEVRSFPGQAERRGLFSLVVGGLIGAAIGADIGNTAAALTGAAIGAAVGAAKAEDRTNRELAYERANVVAGCMEGRGYRVLG